MGLGRLLVDAKTEFRRGESFSCNVLIRADVYGLSGRDLYSHFVRAELVGEGYSPSEVERALKGLLDGRADREGHPSGVR